MTRGKLQLPSRTLSTLIASLTALCAIAVGASASPTDGPIYKARVDRVIAAGGVDLSERSLRAVADRLDPSTAAIAARHDPAAEPQAWGWRLEGWDNWALSGRPDLGIGRLDGERARMINAAIPAEVDALLPAKPFFLPAGTPEYRKALRCLTQAVYYEAALESTEGQEAVAQVVLNRVRDPNFPASVCGVVYQGAERVTGCQFSFTCDGSLARAPAAWAWHRAEDVAVRALNGHVAKAVGTATHYHADYVLPYWSPSLVKIEQLGAHVFYRWTGRPGEPAAFVQRWSGREPRIDEARFARPRAPVAPETVLVQAGTTTVVSAEGLASGAPGTRVVGSLGGRRKPTAEDIARINAKLREFEAPAPAAEAPPAEAPANTAG